MVILSFGSNQGDRIENIRKGLKYLTDKGFRFTEISALFLTPPWGIKEQNSFLNGVATGHFEHSPEELLHHISEAEKHAGRHRTIKWGPRELDIDILEFNHLRINTADLTIPHPWYLKRGFVMVPLNSILPDFIPTGQDLSIKEILSNLPKAEVDEIDLFGEIVSGLIEI